MLSVWNSKVKKIVNNKAFKVIICVLFVLVAGGYYYGLLLEFPQHTEDILSVKYMYYEDIIPRGHMDPVVRICAWAATKIGGMSYMSVRLQFTFFHSIIICLVLYLCLNCDKTGMKEMKLYLLPLIAMLCVILFPTADDPAVIWQQSAQDLCYNYPFMYHSSARIYALLGICFIELIMKTKTKRKRIVYGIVATIVCLCGIATKDLIYGVLFLVPACVVLGKKIIYHDKYHRIAERIVLAMLFLLMVSRFVAIGGISSLWTKEPAYVYGAIHGGTNWIALDRLGTNLLSYLELICLDYNIQMANGPVISFYTVLYLFKIIIIIIGYIVVCHIVIKSITGNSEKYQYDCIDQILALSYCLLSLIYIFTEFGDIQLARYFSALPFIMAIVLCRNIEVIPHILHMTELKKIHLGRTIFGGCTLVVCLCSAGKVWTYRAPDTYAEDMKAIAGYLENAEYGHVVAPYWLYLKLNIMSEGKVFACSSEDEVKKLFGEEAKVTYIVTRNDQSADKNPWTIYSNCDTYENICEHYSEPTDVIRYKWLELLVFEDGIKESAIYD